MKTAVVALFALASLCCFGQEKRKGGKPPDVVLLESYAQRSQGRVAIEGRVKNGGTKPIKGMILLFDFIEPGGQVITTKRGPLDEEMLEPEDEAVFRVETKDPVRAVTFRIQAVDGSGRDLRVEPSVAKPIE